MPKEKKDLRKYFLSLRSSISDDDRTLKDKKISQFCHSLIKHKKLPSVCLFHPFRGEPNVWTLAKSLETMLLALPVMVQTGKGDMVFVRVTPETPLFANRFGIQEPAYSGDTVVVPSPDTLVVVPALAVDHQGVRLGYGGGYYDRYFGALDPEKRPILAAALYKDFFVPTLPHEAHDLKVDYVVTEEGLFEVPRVS